MKIKKGDEVIVIAGKDKGVTGTVIVAYPKRDKVVVQGVNMVKRHTKETNQGPRGAKSGGIITKEAPIHVSNVALVEDGKPTRVGYRIEKQEDGTEVKVRISRRTGKEIR